MKELFEFCEKNGVRMLMEYDNHLFYDKLVFTFHKYNYACRRYVSKEELCEIPEDTLIKSIINFVGDQFASVIDNPKFKICPKCQGSGHNIYMNRVLECSVCNGTGKVLGDDYD